MATVNINVAVTPKGTNITQGVAFAFSAGAGTPTGVISSDGKLDFSKQYPSGTAVTLVFQITTPTLTFTPELPSPTLTATVTVTVTLTP